MSSPGKAILFGFLIWLIVFAIAFAIFPIRESWRSLFESIMPLALVLATTGFGLLYLKRISENLVRESVIVGVSWLVISVAIDLPLMLPGPMLMPLKEYIADIGVTYLIIPVIVVGIGFARATALQERSSEVSTI